MTHYTRFACPNSSCSFYARFNSNNITHRSWTGKDKNIERLRCTSCGEEFSERRATLMENSKISEKTHEQMLKCIRWGVCDEGIADKGMADRLLAEASLRFTFLLSIFTDGWRPYFSAILRAFGRLYRPKRKSRGKLLQKCLRLPDLFYGQVVKIRDETLKLVGVEHRALIGKMKEIIFFIRAYDLGNKIHTIHAERWYGTLRCCLACCRRRSRCLCKSRQRQKQKIWIYIDLYNWVISHGSLCENGKKRTPAMAGGLIDHQMSYQEYIWLPVYDDYRWREKLSEKVMVMNREEMLGASRRVKIKPEKSIVMQSGGLAA